MKKILTCSDITIFSTTIIVFLLGNFFAIYIHDLGFKLGDLFTGIAAISTAAAAIATAAAASSASKSASAWKKQMRSDVELDEAKKLKISLHAWHRHFTYEASRYSGEDPLRIEEFLKIQKESNPSNQIEHLQRYLDKYEELWNNLEQSFDNANFIDNDFNEKLRLRQLSSTHSKSCSKLISYFQGKIKSEMFFSDVYSYEGSLYTGFHDDVHSAHMQISLKIDSQIETVKNSLGSI